MPLLFGILSFLIFIYVFIFFSSSHFTSIINNKSSYALFNFFESGLIIQKELFNIILKELVILPISFPFIP